MEGINVGVLSWLFFCAYLASEKFSYFNNFSQALDLMWDRIIFPSLFSFGPRVLIYGFFITEVQKDWRAILH